MVNEEPNLFTIVWSGLLSFGGVLLGWLHLQNRAEVNDMKANADKALERAEGATASLAAHKLHAAETFARKADVSAAVDKLDQRFDRVFEHLDEIKERLPAKR